MGTGLTKGNIQGSSHQQTGALSVLLPAASPVVLCLHMEVIQVGPRLQDHNTQ